MMADMLTLTLNDSEVMKKDTFGGERIVKVLEGVRQKMREYSKAYTCDSEADYFQHMLDWNLKRVLGEHMQDDFEARYPYFMEYDYRKGKWKK